MKFFKTYAPEINVPALCVALGKVLFGVTTCRGMESHGKGHEQSEKGRCGSHVVVGGSKISNWKC